MHLIVQPISISFAPARLPLHVPAASAANLLRSALDSALQQLRPVDPLCDSVYQAIFGKRTTGGPSGFRDPPRPLVLRAHHLDGQSFAPGQPLSFSVHSFAPALPIPLALRRAFLILAQTGISASRVVLQDVRVDALAPVTLSLLPSTPVQRIRVRFLTPTELKSGGGVLHSPEFSVLLARARDRVSLLRATFQDGPLPIEFARLGDLSLAVETLRASTHLQRASRTSAATAQAHLLQGFVGEAEYAGVLDELAPFLEAAGWTGVGRQTVWGQGAIEVCRLA